MRVLAIVAHPDDESLFAGVMLAKHVADGDTVEVVSMGTGVGARGEQGRELKEAEWARRMAFKAACETLGVGWRYLCAYPDQQSDTVPQIEINRSVEAVVQAIPADRVYTHHVGDLNVDHRRVAEAVLVATRMGPEVYTMSPEFPERCVGPAWAPTVFTGHYAEMSKYHDTKLRACLCYHMELRPWPHPRSERAIRERQESFMEIR